MFKKETSIAGLKVKRCIIASYIALMTGACTIAPYDKVFRICMAFKAW